MTQPEFRCEKCGKLLRVDAAPGDVVTCSHCQNQVTVPRALAAGPRPMPQVMAGPRPQAAAAVAVAAPAGAAAIPAAQEEPLDEEEANSSLAAMSALMPWAISVVFHIAVLLVLMFFTFLVVEGGAEGTADDEQSGEDISIPTDKLGDSDTPGSQVVTSFAGIEPFGPGKDKTDFSKPAPDLLDKGGSEGGGKQDPFAMIGVPTVGGKGVAAGSGDGTGVGALGDAFGTGGNGGGRGSRFFGTGLPRGKVTKVVYVVDRSGSMFETFAYVKAELIRSITDLAGRQSYQVVFFADGTPFSLAIDGQTKLQVANAKNKVATKAWIEEQIPRSLTGRTDPRPALESAFKVAGGPPDLIYFLTDGLFPEETLATIARLNVGKKVHVNTISFRDRTGEALLQKIAQENGGNYKFISQDDMGQEY